MSAPALFDTAALALRRRRAAAAPADFLLRHVAAEMADRLSLVKRRFEAPALVEPLTATLAENLRAMLGANLVTADIEEDGRLGLKPNSHDLVLTLLTLQFVNDLPGVLTQIRQALRPDGLFLGAVVGGSSLTELRQSFADAEIAVEEGVSPRVIPFVDVRDMGSLLQRAGLSLPVTDSDTLTVRYDNVFGLMADLRAMGATNILNARRRTATRRATLMRMAEIYQERFADPDGRIRATFEILWLSGWAPHDSQQKPLAPGSARTRLADALGVKEHKP